MKFGLRFIVNYCKFFNKDIEDSLLHGRNFEQILLFLSVLTIIIDEEIALSKKNEVLSELEKSVNAYTKSKSYAYVDCTKIRNIDVDATINEILPYFVKFIDSYEALYEVIRPNENSVAIMLEDMLIEFNNALSHILMACLNVNKSANIVRANTHLYRGTLDGYKEIIIERAEIIKRDSGLRKTYKDIRKREIDVIGDATGNKNDIAESYKDFIKSIQ